ncbi:hypothetical protein [Mucilaginibacter arboris]|uniref:tRNA (Guanine-N1)-methyltransferase n=1 Tax=Mucilaginibacter arboris TaxID=2682090 RepID=A0A7K1SWC8_9SPHI|nr:hypothetical protein [Mucilaginibacter arboris]MVN21625.1 hypothetical protein [Mucilaginibacter arboris]
MQLKTAFRLLQVVLLSTFFSIGYGQDTVKTGARARQTTKPKQATVNPAKVNPAQTNLAYPLKPSATTPIAVSTDKSLNGQYQFILSKVYHYQQPMITAFYRSMQDTLRTQRIALAAIHSKLAAQTKSMAAMQSDVNSKEESLNATTAQVNSINFLGMPVAKTTYNTIMWGLVIVLGALAATVIFLSTSARREAHYRTKLYNDLEEEYKGYKTKANDKEKKLSRDLQTVRNKLEEITGNPEY